MLWFIINMIKTDTCEKQKGNRENEIITNWYLTDQQKIELSLDIMFSG